MTKKSDELIPTRASLIHRLKNWQDQLSWEDFFNIYWRLIYGIARKGGLTDAEAQDVVQETIFSVAKNIPTFKYDPSIGSFKGWLLNMARWRIADQFRKRDNLGSLDQVKVESTKTVQAIDLSSSEFEKIWNAEWESTLFKAALAKVRRRLDPKQYQIFDFYVNKELPPEKIAKIFSISVGQVYLAKHRVTEAIKQEVQRLQKEIV